MNLRAPRNLFEQFKNEQAGDAFRKFISELKPDIVHFYHFLGFSISPLQICAELGLPICVTLQDEWILCEQLFYLQPDGSFCSGPENIEKCVRCFEGRHPETQLHKNQDYITQVFSLRRKVLQEAVSFVDKLFVPSRFLYDELQRHGFSNPNTTVMPLGLNAFKPMKRESQTGLTRISYLGNINALKGLDIVIQALNIINAQNIQLNIFGNVQDQNYFNQVMQNNLKPQQVRYCGQYTPEDLPSILSKTDVAVVPSRSESYSFVVRECFHAGVPVIASNVGGIPEVIKTNENGLLFEPGNYQDLATKLMLVLQNPKMLMKFRKNIKPMRTIAEDAEQLEVIYRKILAESKFK
ncbi:MAG: glycosyltransferase [Nitrospirota bacterium]